MVCFLCLSYCKVKVTIEDLNDNYPYFSSWSYEGSVWQNAEVGTPIMKVHAFDSDSGVNSKVEYRFVEANDKFEISENGEVSTKASLASFLGTLRYHVIASNTEPMTVGEREAVRRETQIKIYVSDLQPPQFTKRIFKSSIEENSKPGKICYVSSNERHKDFHGYENKQLTSNFMFPSHFYIVLFYYFTTSY